MRVRGLAGRDNFFGFNWLEPVNELRLELLRRRRDCVEVDQSRHDDQPTHIDDLGIADREIMPDFSYFPVAEGDVGRLVAPGRRVDNTAACEDQIPAYARLG